jgi:hypothetical protein
MIKIYINLKNVSKEIVMFFCRKKEAVAVLTYDAQADEDALDSSEEEATSSNCAWCGDPPNEYGSHGICSYHAAKIIEQARSRKRG